MKKSEYWIKKLHLSRHPEGGYYKEVVRDEKQVIDFANQDYVRNASSCIYYLLRDNDISAFHRLRYDETWHFYAGTDVSIYMIDGGGELIQKKLGNGRRDPDARFQVVIPGGFWMGALLDEPNSYALIGRVMAPAFDKADFEVANRTRLVDLFPWHEEIITTLTD